MVNRRTSFLCGLLAAFAALAVVMSSGPAPLTAQEHDDEERPSAARRQLHALQDHLAEIKKRREEARESGNRNLLAQLEQAAAAVAEQLERIEQNLAPQDSDEEEHKWEQQEWEPQERRHAELAELEHARMHLELDRAELESGLGHLDLVSRLAEIADQPATAAAYAVLKVDEFMEPDEAIDFLRSIESRAGSPSTRRLIRMKLSELYRATDDSQSAREQLRQLILQPSGGDGEVAE